MTSMHANSLESHQMNLELGRYGKRATEILGAVDRLGAATDRQVLKALGQSDMNSVRPRITELVNQGILFEVGTTFDSVTGRKCRITALKHGI